MFGIIFSILAGVFISLQGVFNTRVSDKIGLLETATVVHGIGFLFSLLILITYGTSNMVKLRDVNKFYLLGGVFGVIIVFSVIKGISLLGASFSIAILLITQLIISTLIDTFGLFESTPIRFDFTKLLGIIVMMIGIIIFKLKG